MIAGLTELQAFHFDAVEVRRSRRCRRTVRRLLRQAGPPVAIALAQDDGCGCLHAVGVVPRAGEGGAALELAGRIAAAGDARVDLLRVPDAIPPWLVVLAASSPWAPPYVDSPTAAALGAAERPSALPADVFVRCASGCPKAAVVGFSRSVDLLVIDASRVHLVEAALRGARCPLVLVPAELRVHARRALALA